ncbi:MAG: hypothetical protein K5892_07970, partial [Acholeplasmatales bacterium]|nr:hypothetical protein [Acholeplasmatales bacterium]
MFLSNKKFLIYGLDIIISILGIVMIIFLFVNVKKETPYLVTDPSPIISYKHTNYKLIKEPQSIIFFLIFIISSILLLV